MCNSGIQALQSCKVAMGTKKSCLEKQGTKSTGGRKVRWHCKQVKQVTIPSCSLIIRLYTGAKRLEMGTANKQTQERQKWPSKRERVGGGQAGFHSAEKEYQTSS